MNGAAEDVLKLPAVLDLAAAEDFLGTVLHIDFPALPRWQKFLVMVGGPFMNIILALAIPFAGALIYGVPTVPSPVVANVKAGGAA